MADGSDPTPAGGAVHRIRGFGSGEGGQVMTTKQVQCLLAYLGYDPGGIDGVDGQKTRQAIRDFQGAEGLGVDGVAGEQTATSGPLRRTPPHGKRWKRKTCGGSSPSVSAFAVPVRLGAVQRI